MSKAREQFERALAAIVGMVRDNAGVTPEQVAAHPDVADVVRKLGMRYSAADWLQACTEWLYRNDKIAYGAFILWLTGDRKTELIGRIREAQQIVLARKGVA